MPKKVYRHRGAPATMAQAGRGLALPGSERGDVAKRRGARASRAIVVGGDHAPPPSAGRAVTTRRG